MWDLSTKFLPGQVGDALAQLWTVDGTQLAPAFDVYGSEPCCPITLESIADPVLLSDGAVYEREKALGWMQTHENAPHTNVLFDHKTALRLEPLHEIIDHLLSCGRFAGSTGRAQLREAIRCAEEELRQASHCFGVGLEMLVTLRRRLAQGNAELQELRSLVERGDDAAARLHQHLASRAARRIQAAMRRFRARRQLARRRAQTAEQRAACVRIRAFAHAFAARTRLLAERRAVAVRRQAAGSIQRCWRSWVRSQAMLQQLCLACRNGNVTVAQLFLSRGAPLNGLTCSGGVLGTPLSFACGNGHVEVGRMLCAARADPDKSTEISATALFMAAQNGHPAVARLLCEFRADVDKVARGTATPLFMAAQEGHLEVVRLLCEASADYNRATRAGVTPLFMASQDGHASVVQCLCEAKADKDATVFGGTTALFMASQNGHSSVVRVLCIAGADKWRESTGNVTPLFMASQNGHVHVVQCLSECGEQVLATVDLQTSLLIAVQQGHAEVVSLLGPKLPALSANGQARNAASALETKAAATAEVAVDSIERYRIATDSELSEASEQALVDKESPVLKPAPAYHVIATPR